MAPVAVGTCAVTMALCCCFAFVFDELDDELVTPASLHKTATALLNVTCPTFPGSANTARRAAASGPTVAPPDSSREMVDPLVVADDDDEEEAMATFAAIWRNADVETTPRRSGSY